MLHPLLPGEQEAVEKKKKEAEEKKQRRLFPPRKYILGEVVECKLTNWPQWYGGRICRHDVPTGSSKKNSKDGAQYSVLFDDLTLQSELRSRVHRRVVEGVYECDIKKMKGNISKIIDGELKRDRYRG